MNFWDLQSPAGFLNRGELIVRYLASPDERLVVGACPDCAALVAEPDQPGHVQWHVRTGVAIAAARSAPEVDGG